MKIHILYNFKEGAWGGGNQFLKILREEFERKKIYTDIYESDAFIFNSYHELKKLIQLRIKYPKILFIHRLGPVFYLHRGKKWKLVDRLIIEITNLISDVVIFQSKWSHDQAVNLGFNKSKKHLIIGNASDSQIFNREKKSEFKNKKVKLVIDCWSANLKKGFSYYEYLDKNLDFELYDMTFIGNSPIKFKNISMLDPLPPKKLAKELKKHDVFISGVSDDAYSNSIVEALSCGLPVVALDSGGNREIVKKGGELFKNEIELLERIRSVANNYQKYVVDIQVDSIESIADKYIDSIDEVSPNYTNTFSNSIKLFILKNKLWLALMLAKF